MNMLRKMIYFIALMLILISCKKTSSCFDQNLYEQSKVIFCTQDCPGVIGCDDLNYCNACEAARKGIRVK